MNKIFLTAFCLLLLSFLAKSQYVPMNAAGYDFKGMKADTVLFKPGCGEPTFDPGLFYRYSSIYFDTCAKGLWIYDPATFTWVQIAAVSNDYKLYVDTLFPIDDSTFRWCKGTVCHDIVIKGGDFTFTCPEGISLVQLDSAIQANKQRFGIEDNLGLQDRSVDMQNFDFTYTNAKIGINTTGAPSFSLQVGDPTIVNPIVGPEVNIASKGIMYLSSDPTEERAGVFAVVGSNNATRYPVYSVRRSRGTIASPTATQSGDTLFKFGAAGYDGTDFETYNSAGLQILAAGNHSGSSTPAFISLGVTPVGTTVQVPALTINADRSLTLNDYVSGNHDGTLTEVLGVDATGKVFTADASGLGGITSESDPVATAKTVTLNAGTGISITGTASQTIGSNPTYTIATTGLQSSLTGSQGDILYFSATNTLANLTKSTTAHQFLSDDGTSNNPLWETINSDWITQGSTNKFYTDALARAAISLTTTGTSGAATYSSSTGVLNIPTYSLGGLAAVGNNKDIYFNDGGTTNAIDSFQYDKTNKIASIYNSALFTSTNSTTAQVALQLINSAAATNADKVQVSPILELKGAAWKQNATAASWDALWGLRVLPVTGTTTISHKLQFMSSAGVGAGETTMTERMNIDNSGNVTASSGGSFVVGGSTLSTNQLINSGSFTIHSGSNTNLTIGAGANLNQTLLASSTTQDMAFWAGQPQGGTSSQGVSFGVFRPASFGIGTASNSAGGTTVTGSNTRFTEFFKIGDGITMSGETQTITAIASNTSMTTSTWTNAHAGGTSYSASALVTGLAVLGNGKVGIGTTAPDAFLDVRASTADYSAMAIATGTAPTASVTDKVLLYAEDVSSSAELKVRDEAGNVTTLSPHNFTGIPEGPSNEMAWAYYSERNGKYINVDMYKLAMLVERITGEKLIYTGKLNHK